MLHVDFVYFDLDDTLLDHTSAQKEALAYLCEHFRDHLNGHSIAHVQETYHTFNVALWRRYANNEIDRHEVQRVRFEMLLEALNVSTLRAAAVGEVYLEAYSRFWRLYDDALQVVRRVKDRYGVGLITNGFQDVQRAKLNRFPELASMFSAVVVSEEIGVMKPHRGIFDYALERSGTGAGRTLYVGDSFSSDVQGASAAGWQVAWFTPAGHDRQLPARARAFSAWPTLLEWLGIDPD